MMRLAFLLSLLSVVANAQGVDGERSIRHLQSNSGSGDDLGNAAALPEGALGVKLCLPDGTEHDLDSHSHLVKFTTQSRGGITTYVVRHDATPRVWVLGFGRIAVTPPTSVLDHRVSTTLQVCPSPSSTLTPRFSPFDARLKIE